jgi:Na+/melibiose symporter-like transporter
MATAADRKRPRGREADAGDDKARDRRLEPAEWRALTILGLPTFALALAITTVTTYLPVIASGFAASTVVIGVLIGGEGLLALTLPITVGTWSDRLHTRIGGRLPFVLGATPPLVLALALLGFAGSILTAALAVALFFVAYYIAYEPYRALYPDMVDDAIAGRAQSTQALFRGAATCLALVAGGLLLAIAQPVPFVAAAVVTALSMAVFARTLLRRGVPDQERADRDESPGGTMRALRDAISEAPALRAYLVANALWELSLGALKTFVVLYITRGLGFSMESASLIIGVGALVVLAGAPVSGKLADRMGRAQVMHLALWVYGIGLLVPLATQSTVLLALAIPLVAFGGGVIMTLPYALLIPLMPKGRNGALSGFYSLSRGIGTALGPLLAGVAISVGKGPFASTQGYAAMWAVCAVAVLASIPLVRRLRDDAD